MKNKIVVVEATSTAFGYLEDIRELGYEPVILESYLPDGYARRTLDKERKVKYSHISYPITLIKEDPDYDVTLREIKALDPLLVIPGGEEGVITGTRLANDLGMVGNSYSNIVNMTRKSLMHQSLKKAGLRHIRGTEVKSREDCLRFLKETGTEDVVLKHDHGAASVGVHLVHGRDELLAAFEQECSADHNMFGEAETRFLLQERIFGTEYIVNTISRDGIPALTSCFRYYKKRMPSGAIIYSGEKSINEPDEKESELIDYALKTVCALGITDGPVHGEYMIDKDGPVLIEANYRVMGGSAPSGWLDRVFGYHETEVILNSMLDKEYHDKFRQRAYRPLRQGYIKDFSSAVDHPISSSGIIPILLGMKSFYSGWVDNAGKTDMLYETKDLETETGCIYMVHDDPEVVKKEFELLVYIEENYPRLLQSDGPFLDPPEDASVITPEVLSVLNEDPEVLAHRIMEYYRDSATGEPVVPEILLEASPYNRRILELIRGFC